MGDKCAGLRLCGIRTGANTFLLLRSKNQEEESMGTDWLIMHELEVAWHMLHARQHDNTVGCAVGSDRDNAAC